MKKILAFTALTLLCILTACASSSGPSDMTTDADTTYSTHEEVSQAMNPHGENSAHKMLAPITNY